MNTPKFYVIVVAFHCNDNFDIFKSIVTKSLQNLTLSWEMQKKI